MADLTLAAIVHTLSTIGRQLDEKATEVERLDALHVGLCGEYRREFARVFMNTAASNDVRRYTTEIETAELFISREAAEQILRAGKEALRVLRDRLEIGRSLGAVMCLELGES